ncbi:MAG TPA: TonB-dependent receptor plug domain-containing protein [Longimicrobium sp.]
MATLDMRAAVLAALLLTACGGTAPPRTNPDPDDPQVGYGTREPGRSTGAVGSLGEGDIAGARASRVEELLRGRLAGVQVLRLPGGDFTVRIRGAGTLSGGDPLCVIDGVPVGGRLSAALDGISPRDISRIDVLKDGEAAIYGSRGGNGVILITTRRQ